MTEELDALFDSIARIIDSDIDLVDRLLLREHMELLQVALREKRQRLEAELEQIEAMLST